MSSISGTDSAATATPRLPGREPACAAGQVDQRLGERTREQERRDSRRTTRPITSASRMPPSTVGGGGVRCRRPCAAPTMPPPSAVGMPVEQARRPSRCASWSRRIPRPACSCATTSGRRNRGPSRSPLPSGEATTSEPVVRAARPPGDDRDAGRGRRATSAAACALSCCARLVRVADALHHLEGDERRHEHGDQARRRTSRAGSACEGDAPAGAGPPTRPSRIVAPRRSSPTPRTVRIGSGVAELRAQLRDVHVDRAAAAVVGDAPHRREQLLAGEDPPGLRHQVGEQVELGGGQLDGRAGDRRPAGAPGRARHRPTGAPPAPTGPPRDAPARLTRATSSRGENGLVR